MGFLKRILLVAADSLTKESCIAVYLYAKAEVGGFLLCIWSNVQALFRLPMEVIGDLTIAYQFRSLWPGLVFPRIIPSFIRRQMYKKDDKADMLVKIWLSLFNLSKIILLAKRVDFSTFASIVSPWKDPEKVVQAVNRVAETLPQLVGRYLPWVSQIPLDEGVTWEPTWKAIPNSPYLSQQLRVPTIESEL